MSYIQAFDLLLFQIQSDMEAIETKSVAESDTGRFCSDVFSSVTNTGKAELNYSEPSLTNIIVSNYEGSKSRSGDFEGYGEAVFVGGSTYKVRQCFCCC